MDVGKKLADMLFAEVYSGGIICDGDTYKQVRDGFIKIADRLIAHGVTVQEWISVKDRLPEDNGRYLCNVKSFAFPGCFYQAILQCDKHGFREGNIYTDDVTHWMPLPKPPKGE